MATARRQLTRSSPTRARVAPPGQLSLSSANEDSSPLSLLLAGVPFGIVWLSGDGLVLGFNPAAARLCASSAALEIASTIRWHRREDGRTFDECWSRDVGEQHWFATACPSYSEQLLISVRRSPVSVFPGFIDWPGVVTFWLRASPIDPTPGILQEAFGLTSAESRLAWELVACRSLSTAARRCGITASTARGYLKRIFAKTGTTGQTGLIVLLLTIAATSTLAR
jgi:DNA-binding CsgD family transcriptional regulator